MKIFQYVAGCLIFFGLTTSFAFSEELARVNDVVITETDFVKRIEGMTDRQRSRITKEMVVNSLINEQLLRQEIDKLNLVETDEYKLQLEQAKRNILRDLYVQRCLENMATEENQRRYFEENKDRFRGPPTPRVSVILVKTKKEAEEVYNKAKEGEDFAELAKRYSIGSNAKAGGDLGYLPFERRGLIQKTVASLRKGEVGKPVKSDLGYHIVKVTDYREGRVPEYERIRRNVAKSYRRKLIADKMAEIHKSADIYINKELLENLKID